MKVRVAAIASLSWRDGHPVWDDPLRHRQFALTDISLDVVRWFAAWRPLDDVLQLSARHHAVAQRLLERDVLVAHGSAEHDRERLALEAWDAGARPPGSTTTRRARWRSRASPRPRRRWS